MTTLYRFLLRLYPASFRVEYGEQMLAVFAESMAHLSFPARLGQLLRAVADEIPNAVAAHWDILRQDVRYAVRALNRARGFAFAVIAVAAIGVGANTAAFSIADFVLLRPLPFPEPDRLVRLCAGPRRGGGWGCNNQLAPANYRDFKAMSTSLANLGAFAANTVNLVGVGEPRRLDITPVTPEVLDVLAVPPLLGRGFAAADADASVAIISHGLWQSQFGADRGIVGRTISLNGAPHTVIGVMPRGFYFPNRNTQLWTVLTFREDDFANRQNSYIEAVGRLAPGVAFQRAHGELESIADQLARTYPENADTGISFFRMHDNMAPRFRVMLIALGGATLSLLLLTCASLINLFLARAAAREREVAVRVALGAAKERVVRQLMTEGVLLTLLGGAAGLAVAVWSIPIFSGLVPSTLPLDVQPTLDGRVLLLAMLFAAITGVSFSLWPALRAGRGTGLSVLRHGTRAGARRQHVRALLVTVQVTVSVVLLITSGLLLRAVWRVQAVDSGLRPEQVLTLRTALPRPKYDSPLARADFYERVLGQARTLPGVESAAFISGLPTMVTGLVTAIELPGQDARNTSGRVVSHRWVTSGYFASMGIALLSGRDIDDRDSADRPWVAVISRSLASQYWPGQDPIGKVFQHRSHPRTVVGVVGDVMVRGRERVSEPQLYVPARQVADPFPAAFDPKDLVVRHSGPVEPLVSALRQIVRTIDPDQPISDVRTMNDVLAVETAPRRAQIQVLAALAVVATLLAGVGLYGLLAYTVAQRSQEIGVHLALGAEPARVGRMIFADGMRLAVIGVVPGVVVAYAAARGMATLLFGVTPGDPQVFAVAVGIVLLTTLCGSMLPAWRALRVSPMAALRVE